MEGRSDVAAAKFSAYWPVNLRDARVVAKRHQRRLSTSARCGAFLILFLHSDQAELVSGRESGLVRF